MSVTLEELRAELAPIVNRLAHVEAYVDGIPLFSRQLTAMQQDMRMLKVAFILTN